MEQLGDKEMVRTDASHVDYGATSRGPSFK